MWIRQQSWRYSHRTESYLQILKLWDPNLKNTMGDGSACNGIGSGIRGDGCLSGDYGKFLKSS